MSIQIDQNSRFQLTEPIIFNGVETFGPWIRPSFIRERPTDDFIGKFTVTSAEEGRPDKISDSVYGLPTLDWVIIAFNKPLDVLNWPRAGAIIEFPSPALVFREIL